MRKKTVYNVTGVLDTKPENLPDGLQVDELEVDDMESLEIGAFTFQDSAMNENGVYIRENKTTFGGRHLTKEETRRIRDFLDVVLGEEKFVGRVLVDNVEDVWFEFAPDVWTQGNDYRDTNPNPFQRAKERHGGTDATGLTRQSLSTIERSYGPVRFIRNEWE